VGGIAVGGGGGWAERRRGTWVVDMDRVESCSSVEVERIG